MERGWSLRLHPQNFSQTKPEHLNAFPAPLCAGVRSYQSKSGGGKTLISLLAGTILGAKKVLILLPARLRDQNLRDQKEWSAKFRVHPENYPSFL